MIRFFEVSGVIQASSDRDNGKNYVTSINNGFEPRDGKYIRAFIKEIPIEEPTSDSYLVLCEFRFEHCVYFRDDFWAIFDFSVRGVTNRVEWIDIGLLPIDRLDQAKQTLFCDTPG